MDSVVQLDRVGRNFGDVRAVADVTFEVLPGEVFGLLGHNGAGKTTLIRMINGLLAPHEGHITTFGLGPVTHGEKVRRRTGVLTTYPGLDDYLSPFENLSVYAAIHGLSTDVSHERISRLLAKLGLDPQSRAPARGLSAGLKQRVALARALVHDPSLLLLDEPTANLDPLAARGVRDMVRALADEGRTVIFSTHNLAEAEQLCDRVAILREGHLEAVGSLDQLAVGRLQSGIDLVVGAGQADRARHVLQPVLNGHTLAASGDSLHITGTTAGEVPALLRRLVTADIDVLAAVPTTPSLEDVYMAVHRSLGVT